MKIILFEGGFWICHRPRPSLDNFDIYLPLSRTTAWERKFCCISHQNILKSMLFHRQKIFMSKSVKILHCISGIALSAILRGEGQLLSWVFHSATVCKEKTICHTARSRKKLFLVTFLSIFCIEKSTMNQKNGRICFLEPYTIPTIRIGPQLDILLHGKQSIQRGKPVNE